MIQYDGSKDKIIDGGSMSRNLVPAITSEAGLSRYLQEIQKFPILSEQEELRLAMLLQEKKDIKAAHTLITSHLRLVAKIAMRYRGYGLPITDLIAEGNIGLMHAVKKFAPEMGHRLSTYAMWWIKAYIQDYILKSWSLVKIGTSAIQKRLFFNLRRIKNKILNTSGRDNIHDNANEIAIQLNVNPQDVIDMNMRLIGHEHMLNDTNDDGVEQMDMLADPNANPETFAVENSEYTYKKTKMKEAMSSLTQREQDIVVARMLQESPITLDELSQKFGVSRERIRQIESKAMEKLQRYCLG